MFTLVAKELRYYANQRHYRRVMFVILALLAFTLFATAFESFARSTQAGSPTNVGAGLYGILVTVFFGLLLCFVVPVQIIGAIEIEKRSSNFDLLSMIPLNSWGLLGGKLIGGLVAAFWPVWLASPLFWLSIYTGGLELVQTLACILVMISASLVFSMVGIGFTLFGSARHALSRSYAIILPITLLPLILSETLTLAPRPEALVRALSPLCVLLSIIRSETDFLYGVMPIWGGMVCVYVLLSTFMFWLIGKRIATLS